MNLAAFRENLLKPSVKLRYKFLYDSVDRTSMVTANGLGTIRRDINLSAGKMLVTLNNAGGWWNFLKDSNEALGDVAEIQIYVEGDPANAYTLFKGTTRHPEYKGSTVTLSIKDHNSLFLDKKLGSDGTPAGGYGTTQYADVKVWRLLTVAGELDSLVSPANTDINYASFTRWRDNHIRPNNYELRAIIKGQTVAQLLMIICQMTHSYIWTNNSGLVEFAPPFEPGYSYSEANTGSKGSPGHGRNLLIKDDLIINDVTVRYNYNNNDGTWQGSVNDTDATSIAMEWGRMARAIEGRTFWHQTQASAESDRDATLANYAFPLKFWELKTGFPGIMEDLGREIIVSDTLKNIITVPAYIEGIIYDLNTWEVSIKARWPW